MDKDGNLNQEEKIKLANLFNLAKVWWNNGQATSIIETMNLIETFEDFRKELEK